MNYPFISHVQTIDGLCVEGDTLMVTLKTEDLDFEQVLIRHEPDNEEYLVEMNKVGKQGRLALWQGQFKNNNDRSLTHYLFKLVLGEHQYWLDARGVQERMPGKEYHFKYNAVYQPPPWVAEQVFYQIFPDRFANGNPRISVKNGEYQVRGGTQDVVAKEWGAPVSDYANNASIEFYGGDLQGIRDKLDYLQDLGVTSLYLNPIFTSNSNHKYDTKDYLSVDPHLGNNQEFAQLTEEIHSRGMKIVLDAVFNHTSEEHPWFDKSGVTESGAYHNLQSPYRDFYLFDGDSQEYLGWKGVKTLPVLNFLNQQVKDYIYQSDQAVIKHWLRPPYLVDGWRFDVIHMLGEGDGAQNNAHYVQQFRAATKSVNQDAYVLGEHFFEATQWLQGDQEDGAMNYYGFAHPIRALLANRDISYHPIQITPQEFSQWLREVNAKIPWLNQLSQLNQLDSHDTMRFLTTLGGNKAKMRMAATMLFTFVGTPCIYYGTEVGLEGGHDPDNRRCFPWDEVSTSEWWPFFKGLIAQRKVRPEWQKGSFEILDASEESLIYARTLGKDVSVIVLGFAEGCVRIPFWKLGIEGSEAKSYFAGKTLSINAGELTLPIGLWQSEIIQLTK